MCNRLELRPSERACQSEASAPSTSTLRSPSQFPNKAPSPEVQCRSGTSAPRHSYTCRAVRSWNMRKWLGSSKRELRGPRSSLIICPEAPE
eukprot:10612486-Alexandrium_andersonii.AAC.1